MNSDDLRFLSGGMLSSRSFATPISSRLLDALNNEFFKDGKIYCWMGSKEKDHRLVRIDEKLLVIDSLTNIRGISVDYVDQQGLLFSFGDSEAVFVDRESLSIKRENIQAPPIFLAKYRLDRNHLFFSSTPFYGVVLWPSMETVWKTRKGEFNIRSYVVRDEFVFCIHSSGLLKVDVFSGSIVWSLSAQESWRSHLAFQSHRFGKKLLIRTEQTGIVGNTLVVCFDPKVIAGIDIHTGDLQWVIDTIGPHKLRVTHDGIGWYIRNDAIQRLDIQKGELLSPIPVQFSPTLTNVISSRIGGFDMSTTHIIAESTVETRSGKSSYIIGIGRESGVVDWAVPIEGMVTKLFLLNNRVYATGMMVSMDNPKPAAKTLVIEGEGGYIPD